MFHYSNLISCNRIPTTNTYKFSIYLVLSLSLRAGAQWRAHPPSAMDASGQMRVEDRDSRSDVEENELNAIFLQACKHSLVIGEICPASKFVILSA